MKGKKKYLAGTREGNRWLLHFYASSQPVANPWTRVDAWCNPRTRKKMLSFMQCTRALSLVLSERLSNRHSSSSKQFPTFGTVSSSLSSLTSLFLVHLVLTQTLSFLSHCPGHTLLSSFVFLRKVMCIFNSISWVWFAEEL